MPAPLFLPPSLPPSLPPDIILYLRRGYFRRSLQIHDIAQFFHKVEFPLPIITYHKDIYMIFFYVCSLLLPIFFWNHQIDIADSFQKLLAFLKREIAFLFLLFPVEIISGQCNNKIVAECFRTLQQIDMPIV